jgi:CheY-like chemotaxis protein
MTRKPSNGDSADRCPSRGKAAPRLLLVEDYADLADATAAYLRHEGFEVRVAGSGKEALEAATSFLPEIVLCDLSLPDMSGFEVARKLREHPETEHVLFAAHSAMRESDIGLSESQLRGVNVDLFLSKPITSESIEVLLDKLSTLEQSQLRPGSRGRRRKERHEGQDGEE